jgi:DNA replication protein DnaC
MCDASCEICGGTGYIRYEVPTHHEYFGRIFPCPNRDGWELYSAGCGLEAGERALSWEALKPANGMAEVKRVVQEMLARGSGWLYLWGEFGLGKTRLLKTAVAASIRQKRPAAYVRMAEIIDHLRDAFDAENPSWEGQARIDHWAELPVLCIDEFDRVRATQYADERRFVLMDRRYEEGLRGRSLTFIASNSSPESLDGYLCDRIRDRRFRVIQMTGASVRKVIER